MTGLHALGVESVTAVQADRERVVAELPVERRVDAGAPSVRRSAPELAASSAPSQHRRLPETARPGTRIVLGDEEDGGDRAVEPLAQPVDDARVEEDPDREQVGKDDPDAPRRHGTRTRARARDPIRERRAVEAVVTQRLVPASRMRASPRRRTRSPRALAELRAAACRRAHRPARDPRARRPRAATRPPRRATSASTTFEPRHVHDREREAAPRRGAPTRRAPRAACTGPYAKRTRVRALAQRRARVRARASPSSSMRRGDGPIASRIATFPSASSTAQRTTARVSSAFAGCTIVMFGSAPSSEMSRTLWCDLPGPAGIRPGVVQRVDDLRPLARLVVDLLVRARGEERRERVHDREEAVARQPRRRRDHVLLGDAALDEPLGIGELEGAHAAVRGEIRVEDDEVLVRRGERDELLAVRLDDVLVGDARGPRSRAALRLAFEARAHRRARRLPEAPAARTSAARARAPRSPPRSAPRARRARCSKASSPGAPACQRYVPPSSASAAGCSMNETPLPLIVSATSAFGAVAASTEPREDVAQRGVVVPVARLDLPAERAQLRLEIAEREDLLRRLVGLQLVAVDDDPEAAEPIVRRGLKRLPVLALLQLAVAGHHDDDAVPPGTPLRPRDAPALRDAHAERARVRLDARHADVRVPVEAAEPAQPREPVRRTARRARTAPRTGPARRGPWTRRTRRDRDRRSRRSATFSSQ